MIVVGIGASAGGLEALRPLLANLPMEAGLCYVVAQHLDPKHRSLLATLLGRETSLEVQVAADRCRLEPNHIYVCPANCDVLVRQGMLHLRKPRHAIGPKPSVDLFFASLAEDVGERAVGIILSGTGSDGSHGIRAIRAAGGITIAQDPSTAKYNGMPTASIDTGVVDFVLPPDQIARELGTLVSFPRRVLAPIGKALSAYDRILVHIKRQLDCDFSEYKSSTILRRINRRMAAHRIGSIEDYAVFLETTRGEATLLCKDVLISVTSFFRDGEAFAALRKVIQKIVESKNRGDAIRVWVPGCATGEEVYSIAILLAECLGPDLAAHTVQVFGTDLDGEAAMAARKGIYPAASIEGLNDVILNRYFVRVGANYQVVKGIRELTIFAKQNLIKDPPFLRMDLVSCRNLLIYFNSTLQKQVFELFHYVLVPGGHLFLGKSEAVGQFTTLFETVNKKWRIFRRKGAAHTGGIGRFLPRPGKTADAPLPPREPEPSLSEALGRALVALYAPPTIVVDHNLDVEHIEGDVADYLQLRPGKPGLNLMMLARESLRSSLRALLHKFFRERNPVSSQRIRLDGDTGDLVRIVVNPLPMGSGDSLFAVISFERLQTNGSRLADPGVEAVDDYRVMELEQELAATREHLQTVIEELETSNEELQSVNEELQAANEELQSSNEELETSNEELQSTNEELMTVNEELQSKSAELAAANSDLENIQNSVGLALVMVDKDLRITRFTPLATRIFAVLEGDIGQNIMGVSCSLSITNLRSGVSQVLNAGTVFEEEVAGDGAVYAMRIFPYYSEHRDIVGAVLTFLDQTELKRTADLWSDGEQRLALINDLVPMAYWDWYVGANRFRWSDRVESLFGLDAGEIGQNYRDLLERTHPDDRPLVSKAFENALTGSDFAIEHRIIWPDGSIHWLRQAAHISRDSQGGLHMIGVVANVDDRKREALRKRSEGVLLDIICDPAAILDPTGRVLAANQAFADRFGNGAGVLGATCRSLIGCPGGPDATCPVAMPGALNDEQEHLHYCAGRTLGSIAVRPILDDKRLFDRFVIRVMPDGE